MQTTAKRAWHRLRTLAPEYALYPLIVLIVLLVMGAFTGRFLTTDNPYGSYTIQACAWLEGHLDVNPNFTWLELAEYGGKFYVSFPLFPSYVMLPFAAIFGLDTPDHFINLAVTLIFAAVYFYVVLPPINLQADDRQLALCGAVCAVPVSGERVSVYCPAGLGVVPGADDVLHAFADGGRCGTAWQKRLGAGVVGVRSWVPTDGSAVSSAAGVSAQPKRRAA